MQFYGCPEEMSRAARPQRLAVVSEFVQRLQSDAGQLIKMLCQPHRVGLADLRRFNGHRVVNEPVQMKSMRLGVSPQPALLASTSKRPQAARSGWNFAWSRCDRSKSATKAQARKTVSQIVKQGV